MSSAALQKELQKTVVMSFKVLEALNMIKTKNNSMFSEGCVKVSRGDYDKVLAKDQGFLQKLFSKYTRSWSMHGVQFSDVSKKDFIKLYELLG